MNYDEAIKSVERLYDETVALRSESPFPNRSDRDFLIKVIETAKKEHELLGLYQERHYQYVTDFMRNGQLSAFENSQWDMLDRKIKELERELK